MSIADTTYVIYPKNTEEVKKIQERCFKELGFYWHLPKIEDPEGKVEKRNDIRDPEEFREWGDTFTYFFLYFGYRDTNLNVLLHISTDEIEMDPLSESEILISFEEAMKLNKKGEFLFSVKDAIKLLDNFLLTILK